MQRTTSNGDRLESSYRRILAHSGWLMSAQGVTAVLTLVQAVMMTHALGAAKYGVLALVTTYVLTVQQIFGSRVWEAIIKFIPQYQARGEDRRAAAVLQLSYLIETVAGVLAVGVVLLSAGLAEHLLIKEPGAADLVRFYSLVILLQVPQEATVALLRTVDRFRWLSLHATAVAVLRTLAIGLAWWFHPTVGAMLAAQILAVAAGLGILVVMGIHAARGAGLSILRRSALGDLRGRWADVLRFIFLTNLVGTSRIVTANADTLVLGLLGTPAVVGVYELAKKLVTQLQYLASGIYEATYPEISKLIAAGDRDVATKLQTKLSRTLLAIVVPLCLAGNLLSPWVIPRMFGTDFRPSVLLFNILVWQLSWLGLVWFPGFLLATGRARTLAALSWIDAALFALLLAALVPLAGAVGAVSAQFLRNLIWMLMAVGVLRVLRSSSGAAPDEAGGEGRELEAPRAG